MKLTWIKDWGIYLAWEIDILKLWEKQRSQENYNTYQTNTILPKKGQLISIIAVSVNVEQINKTSTM